VRRKDTGHLYAMKMIAKKNFNQMHCRIIKRELKLMKDLNHPFIIKMHYSFYTEESYFFVMDFCPGKDLFTLIGGGTGLGLGDACFYFAEILKGLEYMHAKGIIYRDLKLENV
jgi:serine/threonine protein kinase